LRKEKREKRKEKREKRKEKRKKTKEDKIKIADFSTTKQTKLLNT
jgi:hypothetical protein